MFHLFKQFVKNYFTFGKTPEIAPYHTWRENNIPYLEAYYEKASQTGSDTYIFVNNVNNSDDDMTEEYNIDDFVYYEGTEYIGRDPADYDDDPEDEQVLKKILPFTRTLDDEPEDDDDTFKSNYFTDYIQRVTALIYYSVKQKYRLRYTEPKVYRLKEEKQDEPYELTPFTQEIMEQQDTDDTNQLIKEYCRKYAYETAFIRQLSHDREALKEYLSWK